MTTYYQYHDGQPVGAFTFLPPKDSLWQPSMDQNKRHQKGSYNKQGAPNCPRRSSSTASLHTGSTGKALNSEAVAYRGYYWAAPGYESHDCSDSSSAFSNHSTGAPRFHAYPDPEIVRHRHTLHTLLPLIYPHRRRSALLPGTHIDIVEQDSGVVFAHSVSKKMLVLFLGRQTINRLIRTCERKDNEHWKGPATRQQLLLPRGKASNIAIRMLLGWMLRACRATDVALVEPITLPKKTFAACSLAQTMELFGLHRDALRANMKITQEHFTKPIFPDELESLWICMGEKNAYVYWAIRLLGSRIKAWEQGRGKRVPAHEELLSLFDKHPEMKKRVRDLGYNEVYRPYHLPRWMWESCNDTTETVPNAQSSVESRDSMVELEQTDKDTQTALDGSITWSMLEDIQSSDHESETGTRHTVILSSIAPRSAIPEAN